LHALREIASRRTVLASCLSLLPSSSSYSRCLAAMFVLCAFLSSSSAHSSYARLYTSLVPYIATWRVNKVTSLPEKEKKTASCCRARNSRFQLAPRVSVMQRMDCRHLHCSMHPTCAGASLNNICDLPARGRQRYDSVAGGTQRYDPLAGRTQ
jgi:hypothetical protein